VAYTLTPMQLPSRNLRVLMHSHVPRWAAARQKCCLLAAMRAWVGLYMSLEWKRSISGSKVTVNTMYCAPCRQFVTARSLGDCCVDAW
jgi:hypothetical protein